MKYLNLIVLVFFLFLITCSNNNVDYILNGGFIPESDLNSRPILISPENNKIFIKDFFLIWTAVSNSTKYVVEITDDYNFNNIVSVKEVENELLQISLSELTDHSAKFYCRVTPFSNRTRGISSEIFQFNILLKGIIYVSVSSTASDQGHGLYNDPFKNIEDAVNYANLLDGVQKIYIAEGTYTSEASITNNIEIYGGFSKSDWSLRDKDTYKSVIFPEMYSAFTITVQIHLLLLSMV